MVDKSILKLKGTLYGKDTATLTKIGENNYKITVLKIIRNKGIELPENSEGWAREWGDKELQEAITLFDDEGRKKKMQHNISRAKGKIYEYSMCNRFEWFVTFTIDEKKCSRNDLKGYWKEFGLWRDKVNKNYGIKLEYILVPELHKDKENWHIHGLMKGFNIETKAIKGINKGKLFLKDFDLKDIPKRLKDSIIKAKEKNQDIKNIGEYSEKFGFCTVKSITYGDYENVCKYASKYITKDAEYSVSELGSKMYYNSQGLKRKEKIKRGVFVGNISPDFENDFVRVFDFKADTPEKVELLKNMIQ